MNRTADDIRHAIDSTLSSVSHDPTLYHRVLNASKGDNPPVKKKLTLSLALVLVLLLLTGNVALAAAWHGVSYFLTEKTSELDALQPEYLMNAISQNETSQRLNALAYDAYWDGVTLSVAFRIAAEDPTCTVLLPCETPSHDHYRPLEDADLLLHMPEFINITAGSEIIQPTKYAADWLYEEDGTLTIMYSVPLNDMSQPVTISLPIANTAQADGSEEFAMLHATLPAMVDPVNEHVHDWAPANCVSPMVCRICGRYEGGLGRHNFQPEGCNVTCTCTFCGYTLQAHHLLNPATPGRCYCGEVHE